MSSLPRVFVLGDSISIHYGPYLEESLLGYFHYDRKRDTSEKADSNLDLGFGANGGDSGNVLEYLRWRAVKDPIHADVLLLNCGLHDVKRAVATGELQVSPEEYEANLRAILVEARKAGLAVVWVQTTPVMDEIHNSRSREFHRHAADVDVCNAIARRLMKKAKRPIIDLFTFSKRFLPEGFMDHVHYSEDVRRRQGDFIAGCLHGIAISNPDLLSV